MARSIVKQQVENQVKPRLIKPVVKKDDKLQAEESLAVNAVNETADRVLSTMEEINRLTHRLEVDKECLMAAMAHKGITSIARELGEVSIIRKKGNTKNEVIVEEYRKKVSEADFMASVSVSMTSAKQFLGTKELESVIVSTPGQLKEPELVIELSSKAKKGRHF